MSTLLDKLYDGEYAVASRKPSQEYYDLLNTASVYTDQVREVMGHLFSDQYIYANGELSERLQKDAFREGIRFGIRLTRELWEELL